MNVNFTACFDFPSFVKEVNSPQLNANHSFTLERASYVWGLEQLQGHKWQRSDRPQNAHQKNPL